MALEGSFTPDTDIQRRLPAKNNSGSNTIPAYGCVVVIDVYVDPVSGEAYNVVDQPSNDGDKLAYFNADTAIGPNGYGFIQTDFPALALYDSGDGTPGLDESWGSKAGSYKLAKDKAGFKTKPWDSGVTPPQTDTIVVMQEICRP